MRNPIGLRSAVFMLAFVFTLSVSAHAFWIWTPETNKWINPKYDVKETPQEQLQYALEFYEAEDLPKAMVEFRKLIKHYPKARQAAEAQYYIGECFRKQGQPVQAFRNYQLVIDKYPFRERSGEIVKKQYEIGNELMEGNDRRSKFIATVVGNEYDVIEVFRQVIKNAPYGEYAAPSQYKIGLYLQEKQMYQEARDEFEKTMNDYPDSEWARAARYQIALSDAKRSSDAAYDQEVTQAAIQEFKDFVKENPDAELSQKARTQIQKLREKEAENSFLVAEFYEKQKKYEAAKVYYVAIIEDYKDTSWAAKALNKLQQLNVKKK